MRFSRARGNASSWREGRVTSANIHVARMLKKKKHSRNVPDISECHWDVSRTFKHSCYTSSQGETTLPQNYPEPCNFSVSEPTHPKISNWRKDNYDSRPMSWFTNGRITVRKIDLEVHQSYSIRLRRKEKNKKRKKRKESEKKKVCAVL